MKVNGLAKEQFVMAHEEIGQEGSEEVPPVEGHSESDRASDNEMPEGEIDYDMSGDEEARVLPKGKKKFLIGGVDEGRAAGQMKRVQVQHRAREIF